MSNIKVVMIGSNQSVKGGISSVVAQILRHDWLKDGIEMLFLPTYVEGSTLTKLCYFIKAWLRFKKMINVEKPDIVHIHMSYKGSFIRKYILFKECKRKDIPVIIHLHGSEFEKWYYGLNKNKRTRVQEMIKGADRFIVLGQRWENSIKRIEPNARTSILMNSVKKQVIMAQWNTPVRILFLGVLIPRKGVSDLIEAIRVLSNRRNQNDFKLIIAGTGSEESSLRDLVKKYGLEGKVVFTGWVSGKTKDQLLISSQVLILPSYNEGLPISILEAMSFGLPIIATDVGDVSAAVINDKNGFLVAPGDIQKMSWAIEQILSPNLFHKMSEESRKMIEDNFSEEHYFEKLLAIYRQILGGTF